MADVGQVGVGAKALAVVGAARSRYVALPAGRRKGLMTAAIVLVAVAVGMAWYAGRTDWRVLFSGLEGKDVAQVAQELGAAGISFQMTADGAGVEVPAELLDKARMEVAAKGMPASGRLGFELFDKPNWVGSEFDERVNYQRALEGELEHTIGSLGVVKSARVHLVLPKESLFAADAKQAKASVVLKLKKSTLSADQTEAIRSLVAGAVENLTPEQVTLVDADGRANLQGKGGGATEGDAEVAMETKLVAMLEPLAGAGNVRATVNVAYDQGTEERTDEVFDPAGVVALTSQKTEQTGPGRAMASGVPGTASNTPAAAPVGAVQGSAAAAAPGTPPLLQREALPVYPATGVGGGGMKQESGTFAVSKHMVHSEQGPGRVKRVTAAVVVNDRMSTEGGVQVWKKRTTEEMHRLESLAQAAVGFDEKRGDEVVMENVGFSSNVLEVAPAGLAKVTEEARGLIAEPGLLRMGVLGALGLLVVLFVLRPLAGQVVATLKEPLALGGGVMVEETRTLAAVSEEVEAARAVEKPNRLRDVTGNAVFDQVSEHIRREPGHSTRLLESWIGSSE